jgi:hypothetical protein
MKYIRQWISVNNHLVKYLVQMLVLDSILCENAFARRNFIIFYIALFIVLLDTLVYFIYCFVQLANTLVIHI